MPAIDPSNLIKNEEPGLWVLLPCLWQRRTRQKLGESDDLGFDKLNPANGTRRKASIFFFLP